MASQFFPADGNDVQGLRVVKRKQLFYAGETERLHGGCEIWEGNIREISIDESQKETKVQKKSRTLTQWSNRDFYRSSVERVVLMCVHGRKSHLPLLYFILVFPFKFLLPNEASASPYIMNRASY